MKTEFDTADEEGGEVKPVKIIPESQGTGLMGYRDGLVQRYHNGAASLLSRMEKEGCNSAEQLVMALVREVIGETDHLLGNELIATENGNIRDASVISGKRSEVLQAAIKAVQTKQALEKEGMSTAVDVDSPSMVVVFKFFMSKVKSCFSRMCMDDEMCNTFFQTWKMQTQAWKKELKAEIDASVNLGVKEEE
jgi:hypothetical protein